MKAHSVVDGIVMILIVRMCLSYAMTLPGGKLGGGAQGTAVLFLQLPVEPIII